MDHFIFRYQNLLKMREDQEEDCKNALAGRNRELMLLLQEWDALETRQRLFLEEIEETVANGCSVQRLREAEAEKHWLTEAIENQKLQIRIKEQQIFECRKDLEEAMKKRKVLEKLKEHAYMEFQQQMEAAEEMVSDQLTSFRDSVKAKNR